MNSKPSKITAFLAILLLIFGISYLDFDNFNLVDNIRPYLMLAIGAIIMVYWLIVRSKPKNG